MQGHKYMLIRIQNKGLLKSFFIVIIRILRHYQSDKKKGIRYCN